MKIERKHRVWFTAGCCGRVQGGFFDWDTDFESWFRALKKIGWTIKKGADMNVFQEDITCDVCTAFGRPSCTGGRDSWQRAIDYEAIIIVTPDCCDRKVSVPFDAIQKGEIVTNAMNAMNAMNAVLLDGWTLDDDNKVICDVCKNKVGE